MEEDKVVLGLYLQNPVFNIKMFTNNKKKYLKIDVKTM